MTTQFFIRKGAGRAMVLTVLCMFFWNVSVAQQWTILGNESQVSSLAASHTAIAVLNDVSTLR